MTARVTTDGLDLDGHHVKVSNPDKVLYPATGTTKADVIGHYLAVAEPMLAQLAARPATRKRWVNGVEESSFFEKNAPKGTPDFVRTVEVASPGSTKDRDTVNYPILESRADLVWVANLAALELHTPQWTVGPRGGVHDCDRLVVDLDPGAPAGLAECVEVAVLVRDRLAEMGLTCVPVTSGSKGLQLYAPLPEPRPWRDVHGFAHELARQVEADHPAQVVSDMKKAIRGGKVLIDWSQNNSAKTTITPYSLRGRAEPWVATPRTWEELDDPAALRQVRYEDLPGRLVDLGDPMAG